MCSGQLLGGQDEELSSREKAKARELFDAYDYDRRGRIEMSEMNELLMEQNWIMDERGLKQYEDDFLGHHIRYVDYPMFLTIYQKFLTQQPLCIRKIAAQAEQINILDLRAVEAATHRVFQLEDEDGRGYIDMCDMRDIMRESGLPDRDGDDFEAVMLKAMHEFDTNRDGRISFEEFVLYRNAVLDNFHKSDVALQRQTAAVDDPWDEFHFSD